MRIFIPGATVQEALPELEALRGRGFAFSADVLGEAVVSEREADGHLARYRELLDALAERSGHWTPLALPGGPAAGGRLDWGHSPRVNLSVKPSALYSRLRPEAFEHSVGMAAERLRPLLRQAVSRGAHLTLDMEGSETKGITLALFRRLLGEPGLRDWPHAGIIIQSYRLDSGEDLAELLDWGRGRPGRFAVRLVKGAYHEAERARAAQNDWPLPVHADKERTDRNFERLARLLLSSHDRVDAACASHNPRSIAFFLETARELRVPPERLELQVLYGMAEPVQEALRGEGLPVRVYVPIGGPVPGMAYLIRRLLELTAPEAWLRGRYAPRATGWHATLRVARGSADGTAGPRPTAIAPPPWQRGWPRRRQLPRLPRSATSRRATGPGRAHGRASPRPWPPCAAPSPSPSRWSSAAPSAARPGSCAPRIPNDPAETVAFAAAAGRPEALAAVEAARRALPAWRDGGVEARAEVLRRAAAAARRGRDELAALQVYEAGKSWREADADVCEAIDHLEYSALQALRLCAPQPLSDLPGERSALLREGRGVAVVIAPWNFPLAISAGMTAAALAAGNTVVYKPSSLTPANGFALFRLFREAGLPPGVLNFLPGAGAEIGDLLAGHEEVALVAFTGSREVGSRLLARAAAPGRHVRAVIAELGGKNALIVDEDADLDEAVLHTLSSAFGYLGQKCSACSRLILLDGIHDRFVRRLGEALEGVEIGPPEDPRYPVGAVISQAARERILGYLELGAREARPAARLDPPDGPGYRVPLAVFTGVDPRGRLAREEIFGPLLSVLRAADFEEALRLALDSDYALTAGVFSRHPGRLARAARELRVGNLYLNRPITGAVVGRHPFGGFGHSGTGSKAGGPDYLLHFLQARTVTENTLRRGFYPRTGRDAGGETWGR